MRKFENDSCIVEATEEPGCQLLLHIKLKPEATQKAYRKAVKDINKQISIPGFRKGKAPDATVISRYGSHVEREWKEIVINEAYTCALDLTKIYPMSKESIGKPKLETCSQEEGAEISLSYEHYPRVPNIDFSEIILPSIETLPISEEKIDDLIEELRRTYADWEKIEGAEVKQGDYVDISIDAIDEGKPIVKDRRFEVDEKRMAPWLSTLLIGLTVGESREGVSELDPNATENVKKKFKPTKVRVTLHTIHKIILPKVDDEFAKKLGATSLEDLMNKIRQNLEREAEGETRRKQIAAIQDALLEKYTFEIPSSFAEAERRGRIKRHIQTLKEEGLSDDEIKGREKEIEKRVAFESDQALRLYFLNKQIAKQGNISLTNQELNEEITRQLSANPSLEKQLDKEKTERFVSEIANQLMQLKTNEFALSQMLR